MKFYRFDACHIFEGAMLTSRKADAESIERGWETWIENGGVDYYARTEYLGLKNVHRECEPCV